MQRLVLTGFGEDKPGLVAGLTQILCEFEGNIEDSTMTRLAGQFATLLIISLPESASVEAFQAACERLQASLGFSIHCTLLAKEREVAAVAPHSLPYMITVAGNDRTGITQRIAQALAELKANITDLNAHQIQGETGPVYLMVIEADVPSPMTLSALEAHLKPTSDELKLDLRVKAIDALTFQP
jgi:glycine cleavage system transcriptional repressor